MRQQPEDRDESDLPGDPSEQNHEEPSYPAGKPKRRDPARAGGGDAESGGESGEGPKSTANPDSAG